MSVGVGLIRGINVGTANSVKMSDLTWVFESVGFRDVTTLLRSGNVVFDADGATGAHEAAMVEQALFDRCGSHARVLLLSAEDFARISFANPLLEVADDHSKLVVTYLADAPSPASTEVPEPESIVPEVVVVGAEAVYQWCPLGISNSRLKPPFWRQFGPVATARNWRTVLRLMAEIERRQGR